MQWKIFLTRAGTEALSESLSGMSTSEWTGFLFDADPAHAVEAGQDGRCPQCRREPTQAMGRFFAEEPAPTPEQVKGSVFVKCLCRAWYRYDGVEEVDIRAPIGQVTIRAASVTRTPGTWIDSDRRSAQSATNRREERRR